MVAVTNWRKRCMAAPVSWSPTREPSDFASSLVGSSPTPSPLRPARRWRRVYRGDLPDEVKKESQPPARKAQLLSSGSSSSRRSRAAVVKLEVDCLAPLRRVALATFSGTPLPKRAKLETCPSAASSSSTGGRKPVADQELALGLAAALVQMSTLYVDDGRVTRFHACSVPTVSLQDYATRVHGKFDCSPASFVLALIYLDRMVKRCPDMVISSLTYHRLLLVSVTVAAKFNDDIFYSNRHYAQSGGVQLEELNLLEAEFLKKLGWRLKVNPEEHDSYSELCGIFARGETAVFAEGHGDCDSDCQSSLQGTTFLAACAKSLRRGR